MAKLPPIRKFYLEDYATQKSWIGPLLLVLNQFTNAVVSALNKNLTLVDNSTSDIKTVTLSAVPTSSAPSSIAWTKSVLPIAVLVGNVSYTSPTPAPTGALAVQWQMNSTNTSLQITNVFGITPSSSNQYVLTLVCIAG